MYCSKCGKEQLNTAVRCPGCDALIHNGTKADSITYDYKIVEATQDSALEIIDCYEALGWELVNKNDGFLLNGVTLNFKRNRKIKNKEQINRLQFKLDDDINAIGVYEKRKTQNAMIAALIIGIIGSLIFGAGMSLFIAWPNPAIWMYVVGGILAALGAVPCATAYFAYTKIRAKATAAMNIQIEKKRDEIAEICTNAQTFLA